VHGINHQLLSLRFEVSDIMKILEAAFHMLCRRWPLLSLWWICNPATLDSLQGSNAIQIREQTRLQGRRNNLVDCEMYVTTDEYWMNKVRMAVRRVMRACFGTTPAADGRRLRNFESAWRF
jgi:hypothetical protein